MQLTESRTPVPTDRLGTREPTRAWLQEHIPGWVAIAIGVAWVVLMEIAMAFEPATAQPVPVVGVALEITMYVLLATMLAGFVMQRRWGLLASLGAAFLATGAAIACPATGHHGFGAWWFPQMACVLALVALSAFALRRRYSE